MTCPICGSDTKVFDSRADTDNVRRKRACTVCRYTFTTIEIDADLWQKLIADTKEARRDDRRK